MPAGDERVNQSDGDLPVLAIELLEIAEALEQRDVVDRLGRCGLIGLADEAAGAYAKELR